MEELISIIIPVYNAEKNLYRCINSIINQTYKSIEIILIDDGSVDKSGMLCECFSEQDSRVIILHSVNGGVSRARNMGLKIARGKYIAFVDADDWISKEMYYSLHSKMKEDADICLCRFTEEWPSNSIELFEDNLNDLALQPKDYSNMIYEYERKTEGNAIISGTIFGSVWRSLFLRSIIMNNNLLFDVDTHLAEDTLFMMQYLNKCNKAILVEEYYYHYWHGDESATSTLCVGYQNDYYLTRKQLAENEIKIIDQSTFFNKQKKQKLMSYIKCKTSLGSVMNAFQLDNPVEEWKKIFRITFYKKALNLKSFAFMMLDGVSIKRIALYFLIKIRAWNLLKELLEHRKGTQGI